MKKILLNGLVILGIIAPAHIIASSAIPQIKWELYEIPASSFLIFKEGGMLIIRERGWFTNTDQLLERCGDKWCTHHGQVVDIHSQPAPGRNYRPRLEEHGNISCWWQQDGIINVYPARFFDGEWQIFLGEWVPIFNDVEDVRYDWVGY